MVLRPELGSDPSLGSGRESGRDITLQKSIVYQGCWATKAGYSCVTSNFRRP